VEEDGERGRNETSKWGIKLKEEWKALGVETVRGWCNKVKDKGWLASKLGAQKEEDGKDEDRKQGFYKKLNSRQHRGGISSSSSWVMRTMRCGVRVY